MNFFVRGFGNFYYIISQGLNELNEIECIKSYKYINIKKINGMKKSTKSQAQAKRAEQTKAAHAAMMAKMTKTQFAEKWKTGVFMPRLYELKTCSAVAKVSPNGTWTRHNYTDEDSGKTAYLKYRYIQNGLCLMIQCSIHVDEENIYNSDLIPYAKVNAKKISFDYDSLDALYEEIADEMRDIDREEWVKVKFTKNANGLWDVLLPAGYKYGTIRCEDTDCTLQGIEVIKEADNE